MIEFRFGLFNKTTFAYIDALSKLMSTLQGGEGIGIGAQFTNVGRAEIYENPRISEAEKVRSIEKTLKHDVQDAYLGCKDVMDFITLTALSGWGVCQFTP